MCLSKRPPVTYVSRDLIEFKTYIEKHLFFINKLLFCQTMNDRFFFNMLFTHYIRNKKYIPQFIKMI